MHPIEQGVGYGLTIECTEVLIKLQNMPDRGQHLVGIGGSAGEDGDVGGIAVALAQFNCSHRTARKPKCQLQAGGDALIRLRRR